MRKILVTSAHSDDPVIGMGGTIRKLSLKGDRVYVLSVCGDRIHGFKDAIALLGAEPVYFDYLYGKIEENSLFSDLKELFEKLNPDVVFTHWHSEILYDHEIVSQQTVKMARKFEREIYLFEIPASSIDFDFDVAIDITDSFQYKKMAIELMKNAFDERVFVKEIMPSIIYPAGFRGIQVGCEFAEVFKHCGSRFPLSPFRKKLIDIAQI
ncbi:MAG: PIG-L deacetylase family protein [Pseudothermotoga sp.]